MTNLDLGGACYLQWLWQLRLSCFLPLPLPAYANKLSKASARAHSNANGCVAAARAGRCLVCGKNLDGLLAVDSAEERQPARLVVHLHDAQVGRLGTNTKALSERSQKPSVSSTTYAVNSQTKSVTRH